MLDAIKSMSDIVFKEIEKINYKEKVVAVYEESQRLLIKGFETLWRQTEANKMLLNR